MLFTLKKVIGNMLLPLPLYSPYWFLLRLP